MCHHLTTHLLISYATVLANDSPFAFKFGTIKGANSSICILQGVIAFEVSQVELCVICQYGWGHVESVSNHERILCYCVLVTMQDSHGFNGLSFLFRAELLGQRVTF